MGEFARASMVRGHAKEVAQQKNAAKKEAMNKAGTQRGAAEKKLQMICPLCKVSREHPPHMVDNGPHSALRPSHAGVHGQLQANDAAL